MRTHYVSITQANLLMIDRKMTGIYCENDTNTEMHSVGAGQGLCTVGFRWLISFCLLLNSNRYDFC